MERMLDEVGKRFKPEPEEELLGEVFFFCSFKTPLELGHKRERGLVGAGSRERFWVEGGFKKGFFIQTTNLILVSLSRSLALPPTPTRLFFFLYQ